MAGILDIENREIRAGYAHFGQQEISIDEARSAFAERIDFPSCVAELDGRIVGFARSGPWKARESYKFSTEIGVYVHMDCQGKGIGRQLYALLFPALEQHGFRTILAGIALPNPVSVKLHESFGMRPVGTFPEVGFKHGKWIDVGYWARNINQGFDGAAT